MPELVEHVEVRDDARRVVGSARYHELRYEDLVATAEAVVTKPGYGIVSECVANGTPLLYTSRGRFIEYDMFVTEMPRVLTCRFMPQDDLRALGALLVDIDEERAAERRVRAVFDALDADGDRALAAVDGERQRRELLGARLLGVHGILERDGEVVHLIAGRLTDHSALLGQLSTHSRDFH